MTDCADWQVRLHGLIDGELDAENAMRCEQHVADCAGCQAELERMKAARRAIGSAPRFEAPAALRNSVLRRLDEETRPGPAPAGAAPSRAWWSGLVGRWAALPSAAALAAALVLFVSIPHPVDPTAGELVAGHVRSLLADHLTDVATSDRHTVKPWFNGKIDFSPPVLDLATDGYALAGGRLDYVGGRVVAALVYRARQHVINLFIWPAPDEAGTSTTMDGYNLVSFRSGDLVYWAVSDLNRPELERFARLLEAAIGSTDRGDAK